MASLSYTAAISRPVRVFKYVLEPDRRQMIYLPVGARPLTVACQQEQLVMWVQVPVDEDRKPLGKLHPRIFVVVTTGDQYNENGKHYIGSAELGKIGNEWFVAHVFEQYQKFPDPIDQRVPEDWAQIKDELKSGD